MEILRAKNTMISLPRERLHGQTRVMPKQY